MVAHALCVFVFVGKKKKVNKSQKENSRIKKNRGKRERLMLEIAVFDELINSNPEK